MVLVWTGPEVRRGRLARAAGRLVTLFETADRMAPGRSRASDGTIGDPVHQQTDSRHNPLTVGWTDLDVVLAGDVTHDPGRGADQGMWTEVLRRECAAGRDTSWRMIIFNRRICTEYAQGGVPAWTWRPYSGDNPHTGHAHYELANRPTADSRAPITLGVGMSQPVTTDISATVKHEIRNWTEATLQRVTALAGDVAAGNAEERETQDKVQEIGDTLREGFDAILSALEGLEAGAAPDAGTLFAVEVLKARALVVANGYTVTGPGGEVAAAGLPGDKMATDTAPAPKAGTRAAARGTAKVTGQ